MDRDRTAHPGPAHSRAAPWAGPGDGTRPQRDQRSAQNRGERTHSRCERMASTRESSAPSPDMVSGNLAKHTVATSSVGSPTGGPATPPLHCAPEIWTASIESNEGRPRAPLRDLYHPRRKAPEIAELACPRVSTGCRSPLKIRRARSHPCRVPGPELKFSRPEVQHSCIECPLSLPPIPPDKGNSAMGYANKPCVIDETAGTKFYCACGESQNKPYCDGSHELFGTGKTPCTIEIEKDRKVAICDCSHSAKLPFCDGSHSKL